MMIVMAMRSEAHQDFFKHKVPILFTGVGKLNATFALTRELLQDPAKKDKIVVNLGTAGSPDIKVGTLVECKSFIQWDMDLSSLGLPQGMTPGEKSTVRLDVENSFFPHLQQVTCGTGDRIFDALKDPMEKNFHCDVFDMEAYALAKVCAQLKVPFCSVKYITDSCRADSLRSQWNQNISEGKEALYSVYKSLQAGSDANHCKTDER